jgi:hypothetical protein
LAQNLDEIWKTGVLKWVKGGDHTHTVIAAPISIASTLGHYQLFATLRYYGQEWGAH